MGTTNGKTNGAGKDSVNLLDTAKGANGNGGKRLPNSRKVYVEGKEGVRVPMREITLSGGETPVRVYDTSGPEGEDVRQGAESARDLRLPPGNWPAAANRANRKSSCG